MMRISNAFQNEISIKASELANPWKHENVRWLYKALNPKTNFTRTEDNRPGPEFEQTDEYPV